MCVEYEGKKDAHPPPWCFKKGRGGVHRRGRRTLAGRNLEVLLVPMFFVHAIHLLKCFCSGCGCCMAQLAGGITFS